jgi:Ser/Thr protein kinase RdoA (MazF antagonist)
MAIATRFDVGGPILDVRPYGRGNINDTFLLTANGERLTKAVLQRVNQSVFSNPALIMQNLRTLLDHVARTGAAGAAQTRGFKLPTILKTRDGDDFYVDRDGGFWRALSFIDNSRSVGVVESLAQAHELGKALGLFHALVGNLQPVCLHDTLPGFHVTPQYLARYDATLARGGRAVNSEELRSCHDFIESRRGGLHVLEDARQRGHLRERPIHGDPKLENVLFDAQSGRAISLIDLDTVKPGLIHYDIGDCLRSCCNLAGESPLPARAVEFDLDICRAVLEAYVSEAGDRLTEYDYAYLYPAIRLLAFELGLRFLTDHLDGNRYFKVAASDHNLHRAVTQFRLVESIERKERAIRRIIEDSRDRRA